MLYANVFLFFRVDFLSKFLNDSEFFFKVLFFPKIPFFFRV